MTLCSKDGCTFKIQRIAPAGHMMPLDITIPTILKQEKHRSTQTFSHAGVNDIEWCPKASVSKEALVSFVRLPPCYQCYLIWRIHFAIFVSLSRHCRPTARFHSSFVERNSRALRQTCGPYTSTWSVRHVNPPCCNNGQQSPLLKHYICFLLSVASRTYIYIYTHIYI